MRAETEGINTCGHARTWACMGPRVQQSACTSFHRESPPANGCPAFPARVAPAAQKPEAKKNDKAKPAKKMPNIPGLDSKLFKMAMAEQKSHGVEMHGAHIGRSRAVLWARDARGC